MKKALLLGLAALATLGLTATFSQAAVGPYLTLQGGATWLEDADINYDGVPSSVYSAEVEFDTGFNAGLAIGYDYGQARLEAEFAYRQNDFDKFNEQFLGEAFTSTLDGDVSASSMMINAYWDLPTGGPVVPYIGGGVGFANVSYNEIEVEDFEEVDDDDNVFAYQLAAGIAFEVGPNLTLDLGYRYFATEDPEIESNSPIFYFEDGFLVNVYDKLETEYESHNATLGLRFIF